jgi:hypothetical protein
VVPEDPNRPGWAAPPPFATAGPPRVDKFNGFAIASLVLAIVWLCGLGTILGLVFGFVALSQIKQTGERGRALAISGIVLSFATMLLFVVGALLLALISDDVKEEAAVERRDVEIVRCGRADSGQVQARLQITNNSSKTSRYELVVEFRRANDEKFADEDAEIAGVEPGERQVIEVSAAADDIPTVMKCGVRVNRFAD